MEKLKKIVLPIVAGIGYECVSLWWIVFAIAFAFPSTSPGSREWDEDVLFIPIGYIMMIVYVLVLGIIMFKCRKKWKELVLFILAAALTAGVVFGIRGIGKTEQPEAKDIIVADDISEEKELITQVTDSVEIADIPAEENGLLGVNAWNGYVITKDIMVAPAVPEEILKGEPIHYYRFRVDGWVFEWLISDYVGEKFVMEDAVLVVSKEEGNYEMQVIPAVAEGGGGGPRADVEHTFKYMDVNFDEVPDLLVCTGHHGTQGLVTYYCFLQTENGFVEAPTFTEICNPGIDRENKLILSQWRNNAVSHSWAKYEYKENKYNLVEELREDLDIKGDMDTWVWNVNGVEIARSDEMTEEEIYEFIYGENSEWGIACDRWRTIYNEGLTVDYSIYSEPE